MRRRTVFGSALAGVLAGAAVVRPAVAREDASSLAAHPLVGTWAVMTPGGVVPQIHAPDGSVVVAFPANYVDPMLGLTFQGPALGRWAADGDRIGRFTALQALSDAAGAYVGAFLLVGAVAVAEDGQTWSSAGLESRTIVRDAANNVVFDETAPAEPPVTATRTGATAESVVLPVVAAAGTPTT